MPEQQAKDAGSPSDAFGSGFVYVLCPDADRDSLYNTWMKHTVRPCKMVTEYSAEWTPPDDCDLLVTHRHYRWEEVRILRRTFDQGRVPILILADGVLEYRNTWENPSLAPGAIFQPLIGHKLACIGKSQARIVESWGNPDCCEVVGLPRLDELSQNRPEEQERRGSFELLVATAMTPAFDQSQRKLLVESLIDIKTRLDRNPYLTNARQINVSWRLTDGIGEEIGVANESDRPLAPLSEELKRVDAVITTPSTLFLEAALCRRPVAILDYFNGPQYVPPSWKISAPKNINPTLEELAKPPRARMLFQEYTLKDTLECRTPANPRVLYLIQEMLRSGVRARREGLPLRFPRRIICDVFEPDVPHVDYSQLFTNSSAHQTKEMDILKVELAQAIARLDSIPDDLNWRDKLIHELQQKNVDISARLIERNKTIAELMEAMKRRKMSDE